MNEGLLTTTIAPLLEALRPARVALQITDQALRESLERHARLSGYGLVEPSDPGAEVLVADSAVAELERQLVLLIGAVEQPLPPWPHERIALDAFGGLSAIASARALEQLPSFADAWGRVGSAAHLAEICRALDSELAEERRRREELLDELELAVTVAEGADGELRSMLGALETASVQVRALARRKRLLERRAASASALAASAQQQLLDERAWIARNVRALAASQSWRLGHRLVRMMRGMTLRSDRGADALTVILRKVEDGAGNSSAR